MWRLLKQGCIGYAVLSVLILSLSNENLVAQESQANFAQIAIGGGYRTVFTLLNVGSSTLTGNLILTNGQDGNPLTASMTDGNTSVTGSSFAVSIPSGGTKVVAATAVDTSGPTRTGWAHVTSSGGVLGAVATVQLTGASGALQTFVSVLPSTPVSAATVPVDDDVSAGRFTGYAIANTGNDAITVNVQEANADGSLAAALDSLSIPAGKQVAAFLSQDSKASQTFQGSAVFTGQGGATFSVVGLAMNQGILAAIPVMPVAVQLSAVADLAQESQANFAQIAIGGGYRTVFTLLNVGSSTLTGNLILTNGQDGNPLIASMTDGNTSVTDSSFAVSIPSGGTKVVAATAVDTSGPTRTGWAHVTSSGGVLGAVATVQLTGASRALQTFVSVLPSTLVSAATMPVDDDVSAGRFTGYAIANRGNDAITVNVQEVNANGSLAASLDSLNIPAGKQVAAFLFQDSKASQTFQGSAVFTGQGGATFSVVGLAMNQGILAAIPVIPVAVQPPMVADVVFFLDLPQGNTIEFQGQTLTAAPLGGIVYFKNLAPGTYVINGYLAGGARTTVIRFLNGGGSIGRGGIVPRSIVSLAGPTGCPMGHASMLMSCMASYTVGASKSPQYFRLQFTVTAETSVACRTGACDTW